MNSNLNININNSFSKKDDSNKNDPQKLDDGTLNLSTLNTKGQFNAIPLISDTSQFYKVESCTIGTSTFPKRHDDALFEWRFNDKVEHYFYAKNPENHRGILNEVMARNLCETLYIQYHPISILPITEGTKIISPIVEDYLESLSSINDKDTIVITNEDKIKHSIFYIFSADTDSNSGSVLIHNNKQNISRIDFERCFGYNGTDYNPDVSSGLGAISSGPFYGDIKHLLINYTKEDITKIPIIQKILNINIIEFERFCNNTAEELSTTLWPQHKDDLYKVKDLIVKVVSFRKEKIVDLVYEQIKRSN